jgi:hypothetical protein
VKGFGGLRRIAFEKGILVYEKVDVLGDGGGFDRV